MSLVRFTKIHPKPGRETIFFPALNQFQNLVKNYGNGLLNSHGGVLYFGVSSQGVINGLLISRKDEDHYRLNVDRLFGSYQPFVSSQHYRLNFLQVIDSRSPQSNYVVVELKVSVGSPGEIYEDGCMKVYLVDEKVLVGPLFPQELKELILLKYKEVLEGAQEANRYLTPNLATARKKARCESLVKDKKPLAVILESNQEDTKSVPSGSTKESASGKTIITVTSSKPLQNTSDKENTCNKTIVTVKPCKTVQKNSAKTTVAVNKPEIQAKKILLDRAELLKAAAIAKENAKNRILTLLNAKQPALKPNTKNAKINKIRTPSVRSVPLVYNPVSHLNMPRRQVPPSNSFTYLPSFRFPQPQPVQHYNNNYQQPNNNNYNFADYNRPGNYYGYY